MPQINKHLLLLQVLNKVKNKVLEEKQLMGLRLLHIENKKKCRKETTQPNKNRLCAHIKVKIKH